MRGLLTKASPPPTLRNVKRLVRAILFGSALLATACSDSDPQPPGTVVLVHGLWHTPAATWGSLTEQLDARKIPWVAVDLETSGNTLIGRDPSTLPSMVDDVALVNQAVDAIEGPVVLLGHSYGGMVISAAGLNPGVQHLVYLCALAPLQGERMQDLVQLAPVTQTPIMDDPKALFVDPNTGLATVNPDFAIPGLYADVEPTLAARATQSLVPVVAALPLQPAGPVAWPTKPTTYVVCNQDQAIAPEIQNAMAQRMGGSASVLHINTSHSPMLSDPVAVANVIEGALGEVTP